MKIVVIGGGAAGFFGAIAASGGANPPRVILLERGKELLSKVRISGGGRCNVTHACFDPARLVQSYPRGRRALRGPFTRFGPRDTIAWFAARGVELKTESDGRMFPVTDDSQTIIDALMGAAQDAGVEIRTRANVANVSRRSDAGFDIELKDAQTLRCDKVLVALGGAPVPAWLRTLGHTIVPQVPSLFTFNIRDPRLEDLSGLSVENARLKVAGTALEQSGPLLVTHWGLSGPAVLKTSAWGARTLHDLDYHATLIVDWLPHLSQEELRCTLLRLKNESSARQIATASPFAELPRRLWKRLTTAASIPEARRWAELSKRELYLLTEELHRGHFAIRGKSTFKEEFVTCGGVDLGDVNFKTMESRPCPGLYFAGEVLDIDGVTGGFNFQSAWTTGWLAGRGAQTG